MKSSVVRQKARLPVALAFLNNSHNFDLCAYCTGMRFSSRPSLVPTKPLCPHCAAWRSSLIMNLNNPMSGRMLVVGAEAHTTTSRCGMAMTTLACSFIWPCNSFVLNHCTSSFSILLFLASKLVRRKLNLRSSCLGTSVRVSTTRLTTRRTF
jgi:hypothetical protein